MTLEYRSKKDRMRNFTCERCKITFISTWSEKEALEEYLNSPWHEPNDKVGILCDPCFNIFKIWLAGLTDEEIAIMRK